MLKPWDEIINAEKPAEKDGQPLLDKKGKQKMKSSWKEELSNITDQVELMDLFEYLTEEMKKDLDKFFNRDNRTAGRRSRNYAQKIKDTMQQLRITIQNNIK